MFSGAGVLDFWTIGAGFVFLGVAFWIGSKAVVIEQNKEVIAALSEKVQHIEIRKEVIETKIDAIAKSIDEINNKM